MRRTRLRRLTEDVSVSVGFVVGAITENGHIDEVAAKAFKEAAGDRPLTFHRAFDSVSDQISGVKRLKELGYDRVLTTGGNETVAAPVALRALQETAGEDFIILGSGGLRSHNVAQIVEEADLREIHMRAPSGGSSGTSREEAARIVAALGR